MFNSVLPRPIKRTIEISYRHESFSCYSQQKSIPNKTEIDNKRDTQHIIFLELMTKLFFFRFEIKIGENDNF